MRKMKSNKIVIKVGTSTIQNGELNLQVIENLVKTICELKRQGKQIVLVTSGAIGVGMARLGLKSRPTEIAKKQALASVGQSLLMGVYDKFFQKHNQAIGQVLLTKDCVDNEKRFANAVNTFNALLNMGVVPVVNENDTVAIDEIVVGDNDTLSAYVSNIISADLLIILSDIDGFYDCFPSGKIFDEINTLTADMKKCAGGAGTENGTGGMATKLKAVEIAHRSNTKTILMKGDDPTKILCVIKGERHGTYFNLN